MSPDAAPLPPAEPNRTIDQPSPECLATLAPRAAECPRTAEAVPGYELLGELGRGGMGVVYRAVQTSLKRTVALKMVLGGAHSGEDSLGRFRAEAEAVAKLQHPNIVQVYEVGVAGDTPFFSLEYLDGGSLDRKLAGTPLPPKPAAELVRTLSRAVQHAHQAGIVHRDLKPANVLLAADGTPKVTDFGLAKHMDSDSGQTKSGAILGTPSYMAPEQASGGTKSVGPSADVYALGAILYECLTGRPPFRAATPLDTVLQVLHEEPLPPTKVQAATPRDLETICLKCLHKSPERRYAAAADLADDLTRFLDDEPIAARPASGLEKLRRWRRRNPVKFWAAALALVAALAVNAFIVKSGRDAVRHAEDLRAKETETAAARDEALANAAANRRQLGRFTVAEGLRIEAAGDDLGALPCYVAALQRDPGDPERERTYRARIAAYVRFAPRLVACWSLPPTSAKETVSQAAFSPDGRRLAVTWEEVARLYDVESGRLIGNPIALPRNATSRSYQDGRRNGVVLAFSPDSHQLVIAEVDSQGPTWAAAVYDTGTARPAGPPPMSGEGHPNAVQFTPDGRRMILSLSRVVGKVGNDVYSRPAAEVWDVATGRRLPGALGAGQLVTIAVSADGRRFAGLENERRGTVRVYDGETGEPTGVVVEHRGCKAVDLKHRRILTAGAGGIRLWLAADGEPAGDGHRVDEHVDQVCYGQGNALAAVASSGTAYICNLNDGRQAFMPRKHDSAFRLTFSDDGLRLLTVPNRRPQAIEVATGVALTPALGTVRPHAPSVLAGNRLLTLNGNDVRVWSVTQAGRPTNAGEQMPRAQPAKVQLRQTVRQTFLVDVLHPATGRRMGPAIEVPEMQWRFQPVVSPNATRVVVCNDANTHLRFFDVATGRPIGEWTDHEDGFPPNAITFDAAGRRAVSWSIRVVKVWDASAGTPIGLPMYFPANIQSAALSPDGTRVAVATVDGQRVYDATNGEALSGTMTLEAAEGSAIRFDQTGRRLLTVATATSGWQFGPHRPLDGRGRLWDTDTALPLGPAFPLRASNVEFRADGMAVLAGHDGAFLRAYDFTPVDWPVADLMKLAEVLSGSRLDAADEPAELPPGAAANAWREIADRYRATFGDGSPTN